VSDDSFASFYTASYHRLLGQVFAVTGDLAEAENLLQKAYARAFVRWPRVRAYDLPEAWVRRVALNLAGMAAKRLRLTPGSPPGSFRVALRDPRETAAFVDAFCHSRRTGDCVEGVAVVIAHPRR
jgi:DNA-directed RNA polymerase specialized sigma24 family protein